MQGEGRTKPAIKWPYLVPIAIFVVLAIFFYRGLSRNPSLIEPVLIGQPAPEFALPDLFEPSRTVGTADIAGQYALINVWGSWCVECHHEHDFLMQLAAAGMPILGINWNDETRADALGFVETLGNPFHVIGVDETSEVVIDFGVYGAPETFLLAPDRTILAKWIGPLSAEVWRTHFQPAIEAHREGV